MNQSNHNNLTCPISIGDHTLTFETGKLAKLANGSVTVTCGETIVFASACANDNADESIDFFPLKIDYQEKFSSSGKTLGGFLKREGRPTEKEILTCRLIDRPIRPMFPDGYYNEVQIISYVYSYDGINLTEPLAICAASAALVISDIPLVEPIGAVRVGMIDDKFIINPTLEQKAASKLDLLLAGTRNSILMIEGSCDFLTEEVLIEAVESGHKAIQTICEGLKNWAEKIGKKKNYGNLRLPRKDLEKAIVENFGANLTAALQISSKSERNDALNAIEGKVFETLGAKEGEKSPTDLELGAAFKAAKTQLMREMILTMNKRCDGRTTEQIRPISVDLDLLPRTHGSALFTRGETQALAVCTLGGESMGQRYEDLNADQISRFYLQYSFPPFSVGEVGRVSGASRREIGHGKLAENALSKILPPLEAFAYTVRLESNILESNGSSSMASVCGGCLAMMAAGVPVKRPIAGIAMGLILDLEGKREAILSDILGDEDALGDMDFKVTGDEKVTAFQLDIKIEGLSIKTMERALLQAKKGRLHILAEMNKALSAPRSKISQYAPQMISFPVPGDKIGAVIGKGGATIKGIQEKYKCIVEISDEGMVSILSPDEQTMQKAKEEIESLVKGPEVGRIYDGIVTSIKEFGAFVEIAPKVEGLLHVSEISTERVKDVNEHLKKGQKVRVKLVEIDEKTGKLRLSVKAIGKDEC